MTCRDSFTVLGILMTILVQVVSGEFCSNGQFCDMDQYCCSGGCCYSSYYYNSFWNLWYFWFVMFIIMMSCCGMCSYAKRRQYYGQQHNQIIIPAGQGRVTNITATAYPVGMAAPPPTHHQHHHVPPQAYQSPPAYSEVTSKPDLYPAYQGPPGAMPYPTQPYPSSYQQQPMYPPGPPPNAQFAAPPPHPTAVMGSQPPPYSGPPAATPSDGQTGAPPS